MIRQHDMSTEQSAAVVQTIMDYLQPQIAYHGPFGDDPPEPELVPIVKGSVRGDVSSFPWVCFGSSGRWYRLRDTPPALNDPQEFGMQVVMDDDGHPLGHPTMGPLMIYLVPRHGGQWFWFAMPVDTGWNHEREIDWPISE